MTAERSPAVQASLQRTRSAVLIVLVVTAVVIAVGLGLVLKVWPDLRPLRPETPVSFFSYGVFAAFVGSYIVRRAIANRTALRDPATRARRLFTGHVLAAIVGALAAPLGLAYALALRPEVRDLAPFWVVSLVAGLMAYPRGYELDDFDEPLPDSPPANRLES